MQKRMSASEQVAMQHLHAANNAMFAALPLVEKRLNMRGAMAMFNGARGSITKLIQMLKDTMPPEQVAAYDRNVRTLKYAIKVVSPSVQVAQECRDDGCWLSVAALEQILGASREHCLTCMKDPQQQRACKLAKAFNEIPIGRQDEKADGCGYFTGI